MSEKLKTIDGETLLNTMMKPIDFIIDNIVPEGWSFYYVKLLAYATKGSTHFSR